MMDFLIRRFIRDGDNIKDAAVRQRCGQRSGLLGIVLNLLLCAGKFVAGTLTGSIAITADAFNNLSDAGSSLITLFGFRLAWRRADEGHPFGHGRIEYLAGLIVALLILLVGVELAKTSVQKLLHPEPITFSVLSVVILAVSIAVKLWMYAFNRKLGRRIDSSAMLATAADSLSDVAATSAVLLCTLVAAFSDLHLDGAVGILVALFILRAGFGAAKDTLDPLLGRSPDPALVQEICNAVLAHSELLGLHDMVIHDYGPGRQMMSFHAEVDRSGDVMELHDVIDAVEKEMFARFGIETTIHMDPINVGDALTDEFRTRLAQLVRTLDPALTIHDFRMTVGPRHTNLIFDVVVPYGCALTDGQVERGIKSAVSTWEGGVYYAVIQIDHAYAGL